MKSSDLFSATGDDCFLSCSHDHPWNAGGRQSARPEPEILLEYQLYRGISRTHADAGGHRALEIVPVPGSVLMK